MGYLLGKRWSHSITRNMLAGIVFAGVVSSSMAEVFFEQDFESGEINTDPSPVWSWPEPISESNPDAISTSMMFGPDDMYSISNDRSYTGAYSWRLNFAGRNNWCNQCGSEEIEITQAEIANSCVSIAGGTWASSIFNQSNAFSRWDVTSSSSSEVCFDKLSFLAESLFSESEINVGDSIKIPYQCDVNGIVGNNINRRSDCNKAINYLKGVSASDFDYGETLSRRFYIYIPSETTLPGTTLKLGYAHFKKEGSSTYSTTLKLSVQRNLQLELSLPGGKSTPKYYLEKDQWFYFEEVWTRESSDSAADGNYKLYVSPADSFDASPVEEQTNITIGSIVDISFNGNFQHNNDVSGYIYFDSIVYADSYTGPEDDPRPAPPTGLVIFQ